MIVNFELENPAQVEVVIEQAKAEDEKIIIAYTVRKSEIYIDRSNSGAHFASGFEGIHYAPVQLKGNDLKFHLLIDVSSVELFVNDGLVTMTDIFFPSSTFEKINIVVRDGSVNLRSGTVHQVHSILK